MKAAARWLALLTTFVALSATPAAADPQEAAPGGLASAMLERLQATPLPGRDPVDLATRLRGVPPTPPPPMVGAPLQPGREDTFWVLDQRSARLFQTRASLRLVTEHAYWYVQTDLADRAPQPQLQQSARVFESNTYPTIHAYFGTEPSPGVDGDPRIVLLLANVPGVAAYFSNVDAYPRTVNPRSNEHEMIYLNLGALRPGQQSFDGTLAHEFQHMVHFALCPTQESWVDEGAAELASRLAGFDGPSPQAFMARPDIQLTGWSSEPSELARHYQAAYLFLRYVAERNGGWDSLPRLLATCARGERLFEHFLGTSFDTLFGDWAVANLVEDPTVGDGRYAYAGGPNHVASAGSLDRDGPFLGTVRQFAANYVELPAGEGRVTFTGDTVVPLLAAADDAPLWWSNRGDSLDARLTRALDLRGVDQATARFRVWHDLEDRYDYVYLMGSRDGGRTWQTLPGRSTVADGATGNNYGVGWTGGSGGWIDEEVDLAPIVGSQALLRFEYLTDQSYNGQGFAFRDFEVPRLGVLEPGAADAWTAEGWLRVDAPVPERWVLRLVRWLDSGVTVDTVPVGPDGRATLVLDPTATRSVAVLAPIAPRTLQPANYQLAVEP
jgi:hypothetical protein